MYQRSTLLKTSVYVASNQSITVFTECVPWLPKDFILGNVNENIGSRGRFGLIIPTPKKRVMPRQRTFLRQHTFSWLCRECRITCE